MHLCIATSEFAPFPGGIATYYASLAELMVAAGHQVTVLTLGGQGSADAASGLRIVRLDDAVRGKARRIEHVFDGRSALAIERLALALALRDWLRDHAASWGIDLVEGIDFQASAACLSEPDLPALVITSHSSFGQVRFHDGVGMNGGEAITAGLEVAALALADEVITYSPKNAEDWSAYLGREVRFVTAPWQEASAPRAAYPESPSPTAVVVGRLQRWKGPIELMEALRLCQEHGVQVRVRWIGQDTATAPGGRSMAEYLEQQYPALWQTAFCWSASADRTEVRRLQRQADFAIVPSLWDTFNFTAIEAMSLGTPLIISTGAGASYLCADGVNSVVVSPGDVVALAGAIARLAADVELRRTIGPRGRQTVQTVFTPERMLRERLAAYAAATERHRRRQERPYCAGALNPLLDQLLRVAAVTDTEGAERLRLVQLAELTALRAGQAVKRRLRWPGQVAIEPR